MADGAEEKLQRRAALNEIAKSGRADLREFLSEDELREAGEDDGRNSDADDRS